MQAAQLSLRAAWIAPAVAATRHDGSRRSDGSALQHDAGRCGLHQHADSRQRRRSQLLTHARSTGALHAGDLVVIDLTPEVDGYCGNLARTFVVGRPNAVQQSLIETYEEMRAVTRTTSTRCDCRTARCVGTADLCPSRARDHHLNGIAHGIGLRFEETPASTIIRRIGTSRCGTT